MPFGRKPFSEVIVAEICSNCAASEWEENEQDKEQRIGSENLKQVWHGCDGTIMAGLLCCPCLPIRATKISCARLSTLDQDTSVQAAAMKAAGCDLIREENARRARTVRKQSSP